MDRTLTSTIHSTRFPSFAAAALALQLAMLREDAQRYARNLVGLANQNAQSGQLMMDVNEKLLDGTPPVSPAPVHRHRRAGHDFRSLQMGHVSRTARLQAGPTHEKIF